MLMHDRNQNNIEKQLSNKKFKKKKHDVEKQQNIKLAKNYTWVSDSFKDTQLYYK